MTTPVSTISASPTHLIAGEAAALGTAAGLHRLCEIVAAATPERRLVIAMPSLIGVDDRLNPPAFPRGAEARAAIGCLADRHRRVACAALPAADVRAYDLEVMQRLTTVRGWWSRLAAGAVENPRAVGAIAASGPRLAAALLARRLRLDGHAVQLTEPVVVTSGGPTLHVRRTWQALQAGRSVPEAAVMILPLGVARMPDGTALRLRGDQLTTLHRLLAIAWSIDAAEYWDAPTRPVEAADPLLGAGIPVRVRRHAAGDRAEGVRRRQPTSVARVDASESSSYPCASAA